MFPNANIFTLAQLTTMALTISNGTLIELNTSHSDLGILFDSQLKFHDHIAQVTTKANRVLGLIKKYFDYLNPIMLTHLFSTLVRPILEYNNAIWGPHYALDQRKIEKVQQRATHLLPQLQDKSYSERLTLLSLPSLLYRRLRGDLIFLYKILNNNFNTDFTNLYAFSNTTHTPGGISSSCLRNGQDCCVYRSNYFINRITNDWNSLPTYVVNSNSINTF